MKPEIENSIEKRLITGERDTYEFDFLVLDSPDKWPPAEDHKLNFTLTSDSATKSLVFELSGISYNDWMGMERDYPAPKAAFDLEEFSEFEKQQKFEHSKLLRYVFLFEVSTGKKIPGDSVDDKILFLKRRNMADFDALFQFIQYEVCYLSAKDGNLITRYNEICPGSKQEKKFSDFDDWDEAGNSDYMLRLQRPADDYIIEIPIKSISGEDRAEIDEQCKAPNPPKRPKRDPKTKLFSSTETEPNYDDPAWKKHAQIAESKRTIAYLDKSLPFEIPGSTFQEKSEWVGKRLVGDVVKINNFIEDEVLSARSKYDFFTRSYFQMS